MTVLTRVIRPFADPEAAWSDLFVAEPEGLVAVFSGGASGVPGGWVTAAARRGAAACLAGGGRDLRELLERVARSVRQAGEQAARGELPQGDGAGFVADPASHACAFCLELSAAWLHGDRVELAAVGCAGASRWSPASGLVPLHPLQNLAALQEKAGREPSGFAHWIALSTMGRDPLALLGEIRVWETPVRPGEWLALLTPAIAVPVLSLGARPPATVAEADALLDWFAAQVPASGRANEVQGVAALASFG